MKEIEKEIAEEAIEQPDEELADQLPIEPSNPQALEQFRGTEYGAEYAPHEPIKSPYLQNKFYNPNAAAYNLLRRNRFNGYVVIVPRERGQFELQPLGAIRRSNFDPISGLNY